MLLNCFVVGGLLYLVRLSIYFPYMSIIFQIDVLLMYILSFFAASVHPRLKKRYHSRVERVRKYL